MKALLVLFVALFIGCSSFSIYERVFNRFAVVLTDSVLSSGVRVGGGTVLGATHAVNPDSVARITTTSGDFFSRPFFRGEVAVLYGDILPDTVLVSDVSLGDEVCWIQPRFEAGDGVFLTFGRVSVKTDSSFFIDRLIMYGVSGSGVWNARGELVGIMQSFVTINGYPMYARATRLWNRRMP